MKKRPLRRDSVFHRRYMAQTPEALPRLFDRFSRLGAGRLHRDPGGAGLGLSIVKSICTAHGGEVRVQSTPGQGTCFQVELPLVSEPKRDRNQT